tara:strand:- start:196 stop:330 length:135 start_codon:yes stop_codon:yes gene_type:complete
MRSRVFKMVLPSAVKCRIGGPIAAFGNIDKAGSAAFSADGQIGK